TQMMKGFGGVLNDTQLKRFNQLSLQQAAFQIFQDPQVKDKLKLSDAQVERLRQTAADYAKQINAINQLGQTNVEEATRRYEGFLRRRGEAINSALDAQQRKTLEEMLGESFQFPPDFGTPKTRRP